ncbi:MAG: glutaredoxin [Myxococcales bacterium]|nr:glutaredoxin [Myxococcales bacterium]
MEASHASVVDGVREAIAAHDVVVVGMAWNQPVKKARRALEEAGIQYHYHEIGNYVGMWRERLAVKLWSGWPTFPQVFVKGTLIGGEALTRQALEDGTLSALLKG